MKLLRKRDIPEEKYSNAFLGFGPEETNFVVELTYSMLRDFIFILEYPNFVCYLFLKNYSLITHQWDDIHLRVILISSW